MNLKQAIDLYAGGPGSGDLPQIQREIAQRMANHLKVVQVHMPGQSRFSPTPKLGVPGKVGHSGPAPKGPSGGPKMTRSAPRPGGRIGAGGPGSGRHNEGGGKRGEFQTKKAQWAVVNHKTGYMYTEHRERGAAERKYKSISRYDKDARLVSRTEWE